jgi:pimeloyl-ACP methyl ester carboxylesterase
VFYNDVLDDFANEMMKETSIQQGFGGFMSPVNFIPSDLQIPATYLLCENDNCVLFSVQEGNVAATPGMQTVRIASGHSPMLSQPDRTVEFIVNVASG